MIKICTLIAILQTVFWWIFVLLALYLLNIHTPAAKDLLSFVIGSSLIFPGFILLNILAWKLNNV